MSADLAIGEQPEMTDDNRRAKINIGVGLGVLLGLGACQLQAMALYDTQPDPPVSEAVGSRLGSSA